MLRHNAKDQCQELDEVELSRRSFFGRLAVGAALSIAMPGAVQAAKSNAVKADKNQRLSQPTKRAVRLPKHSAIKTTAKVRHTSNIASSHAAGASKQQKFAGKNMPVDHERPHIAHVDYRTQHNTRVHDMYGGKKHTAHGSANPINRNHRQDGFAHGIAHSFHRDPMITAAQEPLFLADHGRLATHRSLAIQNPHTGDKVNLTYFEKGRYLSDALDEINFLLRDHRTGEVHPIDPELLDQLHDMKQMLGLNQPFNVICGYRSPLTNAKLHAEHAGAASNSFHIYGRAVDVRIERFDLRRAHNAALAMHRGGVGYYPASNYIHMDTGTFRTWTL